MHQAIDIIGDIHGRADLLEQMLTNLGYARQAGHFAHSNGRCALFTGDLVDGGHRNLDVIDIVRGMVAAGAAHAIMGNHDFNIVAFNRADPARPGRFLRSRSERHVAQCAATQAEIEAAPERGQRAIEFLAGLPLWIDHLGLRAVHAFWDPTAMAELRLHVDARNALTDDGFVAAAAMSGRIGDARASLLSGPEAACEPYLDRSGHRRTKDRVQWWLDAPSHPASPLFFGHYALQAPLRTFDNAVCVDAGIAKGGPIVAYRHTIGAPISAANFVYA